MASTADLISDLADATPATRDRYVDFLRAFSIIVVVVGHWMIGLIVWDQGVIRTSSAIGKQSFLWALTWMLQVMPVFFFVGGYANFVAFRAARRRGDRASLFIRGRLRRLLGPSAVLLGVWAIIQIVLHWTNTGGATGPTFGGFSLLRGVRPPGQTVPFGPLWFLLVYMIVVCISPLTIALHERFRWWPPIVMVVGTVAVDAIGFMGGHPGIRYLNAVFVFLLPHQLGHFYGDGSVDRWSRKALAATAGIGIGGLILLTNEWLFKAVAGDKRFEWFPGIGYYPRSLLGTGQEKVANTYPPTICFMLVGFWLISLALLLRPRVGRWLERPGPWRATIVVNAWIMTLFLWHMTAYLLVVVLLWRFGLGHDREPTARWWYERPIWIGAPGLMLIVIVAVVGRFETPVKRSQH